MDARNSTGGDAHSWGVSGEPQYRVAMCRMTLGRIRKLSEAQEVLALVDPRSIGAIDHGRNLTWIDCDPFGHLTDALLHVLGPEAFIDFFASQMSGWSESRLFGPLIASAQRIFGPNPAGHLKWLARGWQITTRNMGTLETESDGREGRVTYENLPPKLRVARFLYAIEGSLRGVVQAQGETPEVTVDATRFEDGSVTCTVRW